MKYEHSLITILGMGGGLKIKHMKFHKFEKHVFGIVDEIHQLGGQILLIWVEVAQIVAIFFLLKSKYERPKMLQVQ